MVIVEPVIGSTFSAAIFENVSRTRSTISPNNYQQRSGEVLIISPIFARCVKLLSRRVPPTLIVDRIEARNNWLPL